MHYNAYYATFAAFLQKFGMYEGDLTASGCTGN